MVVVSADWYTEHRHNGQTHSQVVTVESESSSDIGTNTGKRWIGVYGDESSGES